MLGNRRKDGVTRQRIHQIVSRAKNYQRRQCRDLMEHNVSVIERYRQGVGASEIAAEFGLKRPHVYAICHGQVDRWERQEAAQVMQGAARDERRRMRKVHHGALNAERDAAIIARRQEGATYTKIASELGLSGMTVWRICNPGIASRRMIMVRP